VVSLMIPMSSMLSFEARIFQVGIYPTARITLLLADAAAIKVGCQGKLFLKDIIVTLLLRKSPRRVLVSVNHLMTIKSYLSTVPISSFRNTRNGKNTKKLQHRLFRK
jgi:hypothetical protein